MICLFDWLLYDRDNKLRLTVSNLITLYLDKPFGGKSPVFSVLSFASNLQLALIESAKRRIVIHYSDVRVVLSVTCMRS